MISPGQQEEITQGQPASTTTETPIAEVDKETEGTIMEKNFKELIPWRCPPQSSLRRAARRKGLLLVSLSALRMYRQVEWPVARRRQLTLLEGKPFPLNRPTQVINFPMSVSLPSPVFFYFLELNLNLICIFSTMFTKPNPSEEREATDDVEVIARNAA